MGYLGTDGSALSPPLFLASLNEGISESIPKLRDRGDGARSCLRPLCCPRLGGDTRGVTTRPFRETIPFFLLKNRRFRCVFQGLKAVNGAVVNGRWQGKGKRGGSKALRSARQRGAGGDRRHELGEGAGGARRARPALPEGEFWDAQHGWGGHGAVSAPQNPPGAPNGRPWVRGSGHT